MNARYASRLECLLQNNFWVVFSHYRYLLESQPIATNHTVKPGDMLDAHTWDRVRTKAKGLEETWPE